MTEIEIKVNEQITVDLSEIQKKLALHDMKLGDHDQKLNVHTHEIDECKIYLILVKKRLDGLTLKFDELSKLVDEINIKISDFNIFDALKNKTSSGGGKNFEIILKKTREEISTKF